MQGGEVARRHRGATLAPTRPSDGLTMPAVSGDSSPELLDLTVVVPYYNPGSVLRDTVERAVAVLQGTGISFEVVTVSDGSTDGSETSLQGLDPDVVVQVVLPHAGKGNAVRAGLARGRGRYLGFIDADGDVPPELLADFVALVEAHHPDVVLGSKRHPDSEVVYPVARRLYSWGYQQLVRALFRLDVRDTQAGIKLVRREVLVEVLPRMQEQGYAFDLEMLVIARQLGYRDLLEAPVRIGIRFTSTVSRRVVVEMLRDTFSIWWRMRTQGGARGAPHGHAAAS